MNSPSHAIPTAASTLPTRDSPDRAMVLDSADHVLGALSVVPPLIALVSYFYHAVSLETLLSLASLPLVNLLLSRLGRAHSAAYIEAWRALINLPLCAYTYAISDGIFHEWWLAALTGAIGQSLIVSATLRRFAPGFVLTLAYAASVVVGSCFVAAGRRVGPGLTNAFGVTMAGLLFSLVATRTGRILQSLRLANALLKDRNADVQNRWDELVQFLDKMPLGVCVVDPKGRIILANEEATTILGHPLPPKSKLRDVVSIYARGKGELYDEAKFPLTAALRGQAASSDDLEVESGGKRTQLYAKAAPIRDHDGRISYALLAFENISEKVRAEHERLQGQKLESVGQLAAGIAHEINTPMQYIGDNAHFLEMALDRVLTMLDYQSNLLARAASGQGESCKLEAEAKAKSLKLDFLMGRIPRAIRSTIEGVDAVSKIVRAMKEFSHPGGAEKTPTDINKAIETVVTVSRNEWKYVAEVDLCLDPDLPLVPCLPGEINQVILNMIINASHAIGERGPGSTEQQKGRITIATCAEGNGVKLEISDTGVGIPDGARQKIFDPFFTTKDVGKGTGQGLAISRSIVVDKHGGTIRLASSVGHGTTFTIRLPLGAVSQLVDAPRAIGVG